MTWEAFCPRGSHVSEICRVVRTAAGAHLFSESLLLGNDVKELAATHEFHDEVDVRLGLKDVDGSDHVGVVHGCQNCDFAAQRLALLEVLLLGVGWLCDNFNRKNLVCFAIRCQNHLSKGTPTDSFAQVVVLGNGLEKEEAEAGACVSRVRRTTQGADVKASNHALYSPGPIGAARRRAPFATGQRKPTPYPPL